MSSIECTSLGARTTDESGRLVCRSTALWSYKILTYDVDDPALFHGLPIAMQFVGRRWEDETLLKVAKLLEKAMDQPQSSVRANDIYARTNDA